MNATILKEQATECMLCGHDEDVPISVYNIDKDRWEHYCSGCYEEVYPR